MSMHFADILAQEMNSSTAAAPFDRNLPAVPHTSSSTEPRLPQRLHEPDTLRFSGEARVLSASLRQFAEDRDRVWWRDSGIIAGNADAGYLWDSEGRISGHMRFSTDSGAVVRIQTGQGGGPDEDVRVSVLKDGRQFVFGIHELAEAADCPAISPFLALENDTPRVQVKSHAGQDARRVLSYNAQALPVRANGSAPAAKAVNAA